MIASASPEAATAFGLSTIVGRRTPQLIGERSSLLTSSAVPCFNPMRRFASASAESHDPSTRVSALPHIANKRDRKRFVHGKRVYSRICLSVRTLRHQQKLHTQQILT